MRDSVSARTGASKVFELATTGEEQFTWACGGRAEPATRPGGRAVERVNRVAVLASDHASPASS
jgi:hypothetical protein